MVIGNGFITNTVEEAYKNVCGICRGKDVRVAPLPTIDAMTYWISDIGEIFGCQRTTNMCLTKPLRIDRRYKKGCSMRYAIGGGKQSQAFMQDIMYCTFVLGKWEENLSLQPTDGNPYNYQLNNIKTNNTDVLQKRNIMLENMVRLQDVYKSEFISVAWYIRKWCGYISFEECKDLVSDAFYYLCGFKEFLPTNFVGLWKQVSVKRAYDYYAKHKRHHSFVEWATWDKPIEIANADMLSRRRKQILLAHFRGDTNSEIAKDLGISTGNIRAEICRGKQLLKTYYKKDLQQYEHQDRQHG